MVVLQATSKLKQGRVFFIDKSKDTVDTDSEQRYNDFKRRYNSLKMEPNKWKLIIRLVVVVVTVLLCVVNVFWGVSSNSFLSSTNKGTLDSLTTKPTHSGSSHLFSIFDGLMTSLRGSSPRRADDQRKPSSDVLPAVNGQVGKLAKKVQPVMTLKPTPTTRRKIRKPRPQVAVSDVQTIPFYYVNLDQAVSRRENIERQLKEHQLKAVRVPAIDSAENVTVSLVSPLTIKHPNEKELACIASHMVAIHRAVNDPTFFPDSPYAIIIEDDVKFEFPVNWNELLYNAPEDFDVLQLMTSNADQVSAMAQFYDSALSKMLLAEGGEAKRNASEIDRIKHETLWQSRLRGSNLWSTQAYAVRKDNVRRLINSLVKRDETSGAYSVSIRNTANQAAYCKEINARSCKLLYPFRLVADTYLYDLLGVAYTLRLPLFNGAVGYRSSIQSVVVGEQQTNSSFASIGGVVNYVRTNSEELLPSGLVLNRASNNPTVA